jgi:DNA-binding transcriptional ArsR family regulator
MLKNIPAVADFRTKVTLLLDRSKKGGVTRFNIMKSLREADGPITVNQLASTFGLNHSAIRNHIDILVYSDIIIKGQSTIDSYYGRVYSLSKLTKAHLKELDIVLGTVPKIEIIWHDYGACCKVCARGYDTPRYCEPCLSCKVARSNFVPRGDKDVKV